MTTFRFRRDSLKKLAILPIVLTISACGTGNAFDQCLSDAIAEYEDIRAENITEPIGSRAATRIKAKAAFAEEADSCRARHGSPSDPDATAAILSEVMDDSTW